MKGLELCRRYWQEIGRPSLEKCFPEAAARAAAGLAGEGSDCFGFDDEISRDHDWGPGFCLWLRTEDYERIGPALADWYGSLPRSFMGFERLRETRETAGRVGVMEIGGFFRRYIGLDRPPQTLEEWRFIPENGLAVVTNGEVFLDGAGELTAMREALLAYYPEDIRRKRLAAVCAVAAQAGQYNYPRCLARGERAAALVALSIFIERIHSAAFLLNRRYRPYYKWAQRALTGLPLLGQELAPRINGLTRGDLFRKSGEVEEISALV
ncbi:MAG: DUF4037 domain-containing protein, partial [Oscillospiraceae bacterium]|nr:DUF4037 domain-containing protein [Oscillospiraceae bacterium]